MIEGDHGLIGLLFFRLLALIAGVCVGDSGEWVNGFWLRVVGGRPLRESVCAYIDSACVVDVDGRGMG